MQKAVPEGNRWIRLCTAADARETGSGLGSWGNGIGFFIFPVSRVRARNATQIGKTRVTPILHHLHGHCELLPREFLLPPAIPAPGSCGSQPGIGTLSYDAPLKLGQRTEEVEDELPARRSGVEAFLEALEADTALFQVVDNGNKVLQGTAEPVEFPHDDGIALADEVQQVLQAGAVRFGAGEGVVVVLLASCLVEGVGLQVETLIGR